MSINAVKSACQWIYRRVDHLVVLSRGFKHLLTRRGVPESKVEVFYNWGNEAALAAPQGLLSASFPGSEHFRIVFAGNMGKAQALGAVLDAAALLQQRCSRVCFVMFGGGVEVVRLKRRALQQQLRNVVFFPPVPMAELGTLLSSADALLVHLRKDTLFEITIPSITQAGMAVAKPLLLAVNGDAGDLVLQSGGGVAESENAEALAASAESLSTLAPDQLHAMGQKAQGYYHEHLALPVGVAKFGAIFRLLASNTVSK